MTDVAVGPDQHRPEGTYTGNGRAIQKADILPKIGASRPLAASGTSARVAFTTGLVRVSIKARGAALRYLLGDNTVTASATTSHYLDAGERIEFALDAAQTHIAVIIAASETATSGALEITELT